MNKKNNLIFKINNFCLTTQLLIIYEKTFYLTFNQNIYIKKKK